MTFDWTVDPASGRSNSSPEYKQLVQEVGRLLRTSAGDIVRCHTDSAANFIMAQLAHTHGLAPTKVKLQSATSEGPGNLSGFVEYNGEVFRFQARPVSE